MKHFHIFVILCCYVSFVVFQLLSKTVVSSVLDNVVTNKGWDVENNKLDGKFRALVPMTKLTPAPTPVPTPRGVHQKSDQPQDWRKYYSLNIQLTFRQISEIMSKHTNTTRFLVFGAGHDSKMWASGINIHGQTMFIENIQTWIDEIKQNHPDLDIRFVDYKCNMRDAFRVFFGQPNKLMESFPSFLNKTSWDVILVDSPMGGGGTDNPGRMKTIFWASQLITQNGHVFVHDISRNIENQFSKRYLEQKLGRLRILIGDLAYFAPANGTQLKPF